MDNAQATTLEIRNVEALTARGLEPATIVVEGGRIARIVAAGEAPPAEPPSGAGGRHHRPARRLDGRGRLAIPGFVDLHVHGAAGVNAMDGPEALRRLSTALASYGVAAYCPTTAAAAPGPLRRAVEAIAAAAEESSRGTWPGAAVLGAHLEGPYFAAARRGAQPLEALRPPSLDEVASLYGLARGTMRLMALAPELPGAPEVIRWLVERGVVVSAGHTDATYEQAEAGIVAGLSQSTHTFNGMRPFGHRDPGVIGAVLDRDEVLAEVIGDGVHVDPRVVRLLCRVKGVRRVAVVTDLTHLAGLAPGDYDFFGAPVTVNASGAFVQATGGLAGSVTPMNLAFRNLLAWGFTLEEAVLLTSGNARRQLGLAGEAGLLREGEPADITVIGRDGEVAATLVAGRVVYSAGAKEAGA